jgi:hypothetical protein
MSKGRMFTLRVDPENGEATLTPTAAFLELHPITRADILGDIMYAVTEHYQDAVVDLTGGLDWSVGIEKGKSH